MKALWQVPTLSLLGVA